MSTPLLDINAILDYLPHRFPFLLLDRVREAVPGEYIVALKNVSVNEPFFPGHYPHHPVMPGVLIIEAMAQTAAVLSFLTVGTKPSADYVYYFAGVDNARFKRPVTPGDQLILEARILTQRRGLWKFATTARVDGELAAEAELLSTYRAIDKEAR